MDLSTVAGIVAATLLVTQFVKNFPFLSRVPTKAVAIVIGAAMTAVAYFTGMFQGGGNFYSLLVAVIIGIIGAPAVYDLFKTPAASK